MATNWSDPPPDILTLIANRLNRNLGILRLCSVCKSWRLSLSSSPPSLLHFPLNLPLPPSISLSSSPPPSLCQRTIYLLSPCSTSDQQSFVVKVEEREFRPNTFSLINPLSSHDKLYPRLNSYISLLDYRVTHVCNSYVVSSDVSNSFKKVVVAKDFFQSGDFVVLGLQFTGKLLLWKIGDVGWTKMESCNRLYDDIISFRGKFYGIADKRGRLVMIDSRLFPVDLVPKLMYGNGAFASLVECDGNLYMVDREVGESGVKMGVFRLDDKGRFWDYEPNLNGCVFFLGDDVNFALSRQDYNGLISDVIYFKDPVVDADEDVNELPRVFDVKTRESSDLIQSPESFTGLFKPPWEFVCWGPQVMNLG